jgi:hypothetical protein
MNSFAHCALRLQRFADLTGSPVSCCSTCALQCPVRFMSHPELLGFQLGGEAKPLLPRAA